MSIELIFFSFNTFNIFCHSLLACSVSVEKEADSLWEFSQMSSLFFSCCLQNLLFISNFYHFYHNMLVLDCLGSSCLGRSVHLVSRKFSAIIFSNTFSIPFYFSSPSGIPIIYRLACFILSIAFLYCFNFSFGFLSAVLIK